MWNSLSRYVVSAESAQTVSRIDLISWKDQEISLFTIFVLRFTEPETAVKLRLQFDRFSR